MPEKNSPEKNLPKRKNSEKNATRRAAIFLVAIKRKNRFSEFKQNLAFLGLGVLDFFYKETTNMSLPIKYI